MSLHKGEDIASAKEQVLPGSSQQRPHTRNLSAENHLATGM